MKTEMHSKWDLPWEISAKQSLFNVNLKIIWEYRDLLALLVKRDIVSFYKQTILGPLWFLLQPLFTTVVYTFVFQRLANLSTEGIPGPLFYIAGITIWNYFADCLLKTSSVFLDNATMFGKVYFPRLIMPISIIVSNLIRFATQFVLFVLMLAYFSFKTQMVHPNTYLLMLPILIVLLGGLSLGIGMIISALTTKYRDLSFLLSFGIQLLMFTTPVILPLSAAPKRFKWLIELNPLTQIIETFRFGFLGKGNFSWLSLSYSTGFTIFVLAIGLLIFSKVERKFIDTI